MDDAGVERAALLGSGSGGLMSMTFAATYPQRTSALVLINGTPRITRADDYPWGTTPEWEADFEQNVASGWGRGAMAAMVAPSESSDPAFVEWWSRYQRLGIHAGHVMFVREFLKRVDVRDVLPSIHAPTLVVHRTGERLYGVDHGRYLAEHIPGALYVELPGDDYLPFVGDANAILDHVQKFLTGFRHGTEEDRVLATVMFTDIVESTRRAADLGDREWKALLDRHNDAVQRVLSRFRGRVIDTAGDGFLATFEGPGRAVRAADAIQEAVRDVGVEIRIGLHTGEVESVDSGIRGIAVHIGARIAAMAGAGEVLASSTVKDLVAGSGIEFEDRGMHELKGVPGEWRLFAVRPA
jgi:class 3 adenylate cyclase